MRPVSGLSTAGRGNYRTIRTGVTTSWSTNTFMATTAPASGPDTRPAGLGASHQTGWTGAIARLMDVFGRLTPDRALDVTKAGVLGDMTRDSASGGSASSGSNAPTA